MIQVGVIVFWVWHYLGTWGLLLIAIATGDMALVAIMYEAYLWKSTDKKAD